MRQHDPVAEDYFSALGFTIIVADTSEMLDYLSGLNIPASRASISPLEPTSSLFPVYAIPEPHTVPVRPLRYFYEGNPPSWHDIFSGTLHKTRHFRGVMNLLNAGRSAIVIGIPASGKTTLMMQLASEFEFDGHKLVCDALTADEVHLIMNKLNGTRALLFLDNCADSVQALDLLLSASNVQVAGFDRDTNYETAAHRLDSRLFEILDITEIPDEDLQAIYSRMPVDLRAPQYKAPQTSRGANPSVYEVIRANASRQLPSLQNRFRSLLHTLLRDDENLHDLLVMISYVHACRTPVSFDMIYSFLRGMVQDYQDVYDSVARLGQLVVHSSTPYELTDAEQDYFVPRSTFVAEAVLSVVGADAFRRVFVRFNTEVSPYRIPNYDAFKRKAFDEAHARRAFPAASDWEAGLSFYESAYNRDPSPYLLQQGALFLAHAKQTREAFQWIDRAVRESRYRIPSILNSQAVILFDANIDFARRKPTDASIRQTLDESMSILERCYHDDRRRTYHALRFAHQAIEYWNVNRDSVAGGYLRTAKEWLDEEMRYVPWRSQDIQRLSRDVEQLLFS